MQIRIQFRDSITRDQAIGKWFSAGYLLATTQIENCEDKFIISSRGEKLTFCKFENLVRVQVDMDKFYSEIEDIFYPKITDQEMVDDYQDFFKEFTCKK